MTFVLQPWQLLVAILAGWLNRQQQAIIDFQQTEIQILWERLGKKRIRLSDDQRRRLAVKGKVLGRKLLGEVGSVFTPDTILRWHRQLVAEKWNHAERRSKPGRPPTSPEVVELVLRFARENPTWGYDRIQGALANLGHDLSDATVGNILKAHGIEPAPNRKRQTTWKTFLKAHWDVLASVDFTTIEVWTRGGLVTYYLLFVMEVATRRVHFAGCTPNPGDPWMQQIARNLSDGIDGFLNGKKYLIMDRDTKFSEAFCRILKGAGVSCLKLPPRSPNLSPHIERFMRSLKCEALSRLICFGEDSLRRAVMSFLEHYHLERNHQGLDNRIITAGIEVGRADGPIECRKRLGGMLRYYHRRAA
jgi:putative transposase